MEYCPTCEARYRGEVICSRCGTDLSEILAVEQVANFWCKHALAALQAGQFMAAYDHARRAFETHSSIQTAQALALAALACRKFNEAFRLWVFIRETSQKSALSPDPF